MSADLERLAIQALTTPSTDARGSLEVLTDALIEAALIPDAPRPVLLASASAWARLTVEQPNGATDPPALAREAVDRALIGERVLVLVISHQEAARVDELTREELLARLAGHASPYDVLEVLDRIHVELPHADARIRGVTFSKILRSG